MEAVSAAEAASTWSGHAHLLCPLRLSPGEASGDQRDDDQAYHQRPAWTGHSHVSTPVESTVAVASLAEARLQR